MSDSEDDTSGEEEIFCMLCTLLISDSKYALCDSCKRPNHYSCADISTTEQRTLQLKGKRRLKFFCDDCEKGLSALPEVLSAVSSLKLEINSLKKTMGKSSRYGLSDVGVQEQTIQEARAVQQAQTVQFEQIMEEYTERQQKMKNIIFYNVKESKDPDVGKRQDEDKKEVENVIRSFTKECPDIIMATRLGRKNNDGPRPLRIVFRESSAALNILKRKHLYNGHIGLSSDKTLQQRNQLKYLNSEVNRLNAIEGGQKKKIKYIKGFPKIVDLNPSRPKNSTEQQDRPSGSTTRT